MNQQPHGGVVGSRRNNRLKLGALFQSAPDQQQIETVLQVHQWTSPVREIMQDVPGFNAATVDLTNKIIASGISNRKARRTTGTPPVPSPPTHKPLPARAHEWASAIVQDHVREYNQALVGTKT
jgi:hypothetical protein